MRPILVVDDDVIVRRMIERMLAARGWPVLTASGGAAALQQVRDGLDPCVVICDLCMPGVGGLQVVEALRALPDAATVPILILSGQGMNSVRDEAMAAGANATMTKPFSTADLLDVVESLLASGRRTGTEG